jgi:hypothetical protein
LAAQKNIPSGGGPYNLEKTQCLSSSQRADIIFTLQEQYKLSPKLQAYGNDVSKMTSFSFPVRSSEDSELEDIYGISNFVDHNNESNGDHNLWVTDYDCGARSYDLASGYDHTGTDIFSWPFPWQKMDDNIAEIVAAEEGMIIYREDGNFDRNCAFCTNCSWNAVYLRHANGNVSWYGHLKKGSVTYKNTGDMVAKGEYLGIMGSSGSSTGPHLHFEVWEDNSYTKLLDPYKGTCNLLNSDSMWEVQEDYLVPTILGLATGDSNPTPQACGMQWERNFENVFAPSETIYFSAYFRDQILNEVAEHTVYDAAGQVVDIWFQGFNNSYNASWWWFDRTYNGNYVQGIWTYEIKYADDIKTHTFQVGTLSNVENLFDQKFKFINNIPNRELRIENQVKEFKNLEYSVIDSQGKVLSHNQLKEITIINTQAFSPGIYFFNIEDSHTRSSYTKKFLIF